MKQVTWLPYERPEYGDVLLNPVCRRDEDLWTTRAPLICFHLVEYHMPHRVQRQFGRLQEFPPMESSTSVELYK